MDKVEAFLEANKNLPRETETGAKILIVEDADGWLHVGLEMQEDTTSRAARAAIPLLALWRDRLLEFQGASLARPGVFLFELYTRAVDSGHTTTAQIAEKFNREISASVRAYFADVNQTQPLNAAHTLLRLWGVKDRTARNLLYGALQELDAGRAPFEHGAPISAEMVRSKLNTWRRGKRHQAMVGRRLGAR